MNEFPIRPGDPTIGDQLAPTIYAIRHGQPLLRDHQEHQVSYIGNARSKALVRKDHTKSRRGCSSCKRRRIKCPENRPICTQCHRRGLKCEWPQFHIFQAEGITKNSISVSKQVDLPMPNFTIQDFRLFNHFIQGAYPNKPMESKSVWTHEVPSIAHNYDYLLHAMLAVSASDLEVISNQGSPELTQSAIYHRFHAIKSLNCAMSTGLHTFEEGNAMLATIYILIFQSTMMDDGLAEYLIFVRGLVLISLQMGSKGLKFLFHNMLTNDDTQDIDPHVEGTPETDLGPLDDVNASLEKCRPLCGRGPEKIVHACLLHIVHNLYSSPQEAYKAWTKAGGVFSCHISHTDFQAFIHPSNPIGQLLQSHLIAIQTFITPVGLGYQISKYILQSANCLIKWLDVIHANIEPGMRQYYEWPIKRTEEFREWYLCEKALVSG